MIMIRSQRGRNEEKGERVMEVERKKQKEEEGGCINSSTHDKHVTISH